MSLKILDIKNLCTGCGACVSICPKEALRLEYDEEGFYYPSLNNDLCVDCKSCERACHVLSKQIPEKPSRGYTAYMCKSLDKELVADSSSGGIFSSLANIIIKRGGAVYGARYNYGTERLEHCSTDDCSLKELRKSKYIESYTGTIFSKVKQDLKNDRWVLFCGTPCQLAGLTQYLKINNVSLDKLLRVRFICHGVPSNKFFTEYKHFEEKRFGAPIKYFDFRPKINGWASSDWLMEFSNGKVSSGPYYYYYYYYYYYFQMNYLLRQSCYQCGHLHHELSDFTIADFWGIVFYKPELMEKEGLSLVMAHTDKAIAFVNELKETCSIEQLPLSATDYIYKDATQKKHLLNNRILKGEEVKRRGYMSIAKKELRIKIFKNKIRGLFIDLKNRLLS